MTPINCKLTELGKLNGNEVIVATDDAGSNVIIGGHRCVVHFLSPAYKNHETAVMMGKRIITLKKIPKRFTNMKNEKEAMSHSFVNLGMMAINGYARWEHNRNQSNNRNAS